jgi:hypothetical protein
MENIEKFILSDEFQYNRVPESVVNTSLLSEKEKKIFFVIFDDVETYVAQNYSTANPKYITDKYDLSEKAARGILLSCLYYLK